MFFASEIPEDFALIKNAVKRMTQEKIGVSVELVPLLDLLGSAQMVDPRRTAELEMLSKQGIFFDLYPEMLPGLEPMALDNLLDSYGQGIKELVGELRLSCVSSGGSLYGLPTINDSVSSVGFTMRKDILQKYNIDISSITDITDLDTLFSKVHQNEPDMYMVSGYSTRNSFLSRYKAMTAVPFTMMDISSDDPDVLINFYQTDLYRNVLTMLRGWYESDYLPDMMPLQDIRASQLVNAGDLFGYFCAYKPGIDFEESQNAGYEMVTIPLAEPIVTAYSLTLTQWHISSACTNPGKAMQYLRLLYTDPDLVNLLIYGIEGIHYVKQADGTIAYPDGITTETVGFRNTLAWMLPNQLISYVWNGNDPQVWDKVREYNETTLISETIDFRFDPENVPAELASTMSILMKYGYGLETGQLDPSIYLPLMIDEMQAAGAERVLAEAQRQYDEFIQTEQKIDEKKVE
jgi:putative aldouronate transport system substrate-binding protein